MADETDAPKPKEPSVTDSLLLLMQSTAKDVGALTQKVNDTSRQNEAILAQNQKSNDHYVEVMSEIKKLGSEFIDVRQRQTKLEDTVAQHFANQIPMRPRSPSFTDEERRLQTESIRTVATEAEKQTPYLEQLANASLAQTSAMESQRPVIEKIAKSSEKIAKSSKWVTVGTILGSFCAAFAAGLIHSCH